MLTYTKKDERDFAEWLCTPAGFIGGLAKFEDEPIELERYQLQFLNDHSNYRWIVKSRQVGFSFVFALDALAKSHLRNTYNGFFISYNLDDAKEKILIARQVHEQLPLAFQKKLVSDNKTELTFQSNSANKSLSRIVSSPSKAPRGKRGDIYLDELAHYLNDKEVYTGSTALILRSRGQLSSASTPLGRRGIFWEIADQELRKYPHHTRQLVPWWACKFFCIDVKTALKEAASLPTEIRVEKFGTEDLIQQYESLPLEDFQQEFECKFVDQTYSYYPYELILPNTTDQLTIYEDFSKFRKPKGRLVAGFDVGRTKDKSELSIFEDRNDIFYCRMLKSFDNVPFSEQEAELRAMLDTLPIARLSIDKTGIGMNLAENLERDYPQVVAEAFSTASKEQWATDFKILLQKQNVLLPKDRDLVSQIHSIKRKVLPSGRVSFDAEKTKQGHADRFWSIVMAVQKERGKVIDSGGEVGCRVLG